MTSELSRAAAALADLAHTLESDEDAGARIRRAAEQVRALMLSDACAFVHTVASLAPSRIVAPALDPAAAGRLLAEAEALLAAVLDRDVPSPGPLSTPGGRPHLAVPLVALGEVVGVVLVEREGAEYLRRELQLLAIAASQLGAYLAGLKAREVQRLAALAVEDALEATRSLGERKTQFLNVLSHELRNPLAPLRDAVYVLDRADPASPAARRAREIVGRQVEHLARLVEDLLDDTRLSTGKVHLRRARLDLAALVTQTVEDHRHLFERAGIRVALRVPPAPIWIDGDATRVAQVVGNLLANAQKFTTTGGSVTIEVALEPPATAAVRLVDDGVGMSAETVARLFERYAQGDEALARSQAGLGLGLALAKGLVELHGGTIEARSGGPGCGAEFVVRLPALAGDPPAADEAWRPVAPPHRVLVIDDNRDAAEAIRELLRLAGHAVEVAGDGAAGLALARTSRPDVVLCDLDLPGMSGFDVARALGDLGDPPVLVAVTGLGSAEARERAREAGFRRLLVKPVALPELERILEEAPAPR